MGQGSGGTVGRGTGTAGAGRAALGAGDLNALGDDYLDRLRRHIRRFMVYPEVAKKQKQQGDGVMTVLLRRDGTVVDVWIARSSGYLVLDQAALKAVRDSSRVPPFPDRFPNAEGEIDLPFDFHLGFLDRVFN
jgi:protein TonB